MNTIHYFETMTTGEVYDECQCNAYIKDGDILVADHGSVAILYVAWPTWVKGPVGEFHTTNEGFDWATVDSGKYAEAIKIALSVLDQSKDSVGFI